MHSDNGILGSVPGQYIAAGSCGLPEPGAAMADRMSVTVDAA